MTDVWSKGYGWVYEIVVVVYLDTASSKKVRGSRQSRDANLGSAGVRPLGCSAATGVQDLASSEDEELDIDQKTLTTRINLTTLS